MIEEKQILLDSKAIAKKFGIKSTTIENERRKGNIKGSKIGRSYLYTLSEIQRYLGINPDTNEVMQLRLENEKLKSKVCMYQNQYNNIKQVIEVLNGACNVL
ncbi:helix-turn-helix domain-containing protein [Clostridium butyricum]|uniref:helix-turn-helix domain-containing protein n=1 Tax=Clostridium butyricum TaxID=1492 RepID=UPI00016B9D3E|nr:helix-turn-helix domain-containing protein [Clostridium butyricum]EDT73717.1 putative spindle pole body-associated protein CIK1 [Clostridium butyricum 5521]NFL31135.1 helix-turn-helix domain-containing protein [Clostridium butyricum]